MPQVATAAAEGGDAEDGPAVLEARQSELDTLVEALLEENKELQEELATVSLENAGVGNE